MKRKIYFFLEQLEINRNERITVTILMSLIIIFSGIYYYQEPKVNYDPDEYEKLERIFMEKSNQVEQDRQKILARYQPIHETAATRDELEWNKSSAIENERLSGTEEESGTEMSPKIININTASEEQLVSLPGIGPAYARRIVEWKEENGLFTEIDQLLEIRGIGERRLEQLIPFIEL